MLDGATKASRIVHGEGTESRPFSQFRARRHFERHCRDLNSGNEKGSVENVMGFLRRNLSYPCRRSARSPSPASTMARLTYRSYSGQQPAISDCLNPKNRPDSLGFAR